MDHHSPWNASDKSQAQDSIQNLCCFAMINKHAGMAQQKIPFDMNAAIDTLREGKDLMGNI